MSLILLDLKKGELFNHPQPNGKPGIITFESPEDIKEYLATLPTPPKHKVIRLTTRETKLLSNKVEW